MRGAPSEPSFVPHPLAVLASAFAFGVVAAHLAALPLALLLIGDVILSLAAVFYLLRESPRQAALILIFAFFATGATLAALERDNRHTDRVQRLYEDSIIASGEPVEVTGVMDRGPEPAPDGVYVSLDVESLRFKGREFAVKGHVSLFAPMRNNVARLEYDYLELRYGARLRVMIALSRAEQFRNPGVSPLSEYLERRDLDATGIIKSPLLIERLDDVRVFLPLAWLYEWRESLLSEIDGRFSIETAGVLKAAFLGNRYQLSHAAAERFRDAGTFHVLVISGMHISFIGGMVLWLMSHLTKRRLWQFVVTASFLWAYTIAVGAEVSVVRAALMFTLIALAPVVHRRARSLNALGGATLVLLVWRPNDLFDPSLQLTFLSVLAIITIGWPLLERVRDVGAWYPTREKPYPPSCPEWFRVIAEALFWNERAWQAELARSNFNYKLFKTSLALRLESLHLQRTLRYAASAVVVSVSVQLTLLPLLIIYFHRISLSSLLLNIIVGILMALLALAALVAILISHLGAWLAAPFVKLAEALNWLMVHSVDPFAHLGIASVRLPEYSGWPSGIYVLYYIPLVALAVCMARWNPFARARRSTGSSIPVQQIATLAAAVLIVLLTVIVAHPLSQGRADGRLRIDFLDVGQGDAVFVTMPDGTTLLVDGGGRPRFNQPHNSTGDDDMAVPFERDGRSIGEAVVSEYLWWRGLDHVDYVLASHADADHIDGLNDVLRNFRVRAGLVARAPAGDPEFAQFATTARSVNVPLLLIGRGDILQFGDVDMDVLWPPPLQDWAAPSRNNDSIVLRLRYGNRTFLLTGDIEKNAEAALTNGQDDLHCDAVKAAHHGSRTSSTDAFVNATRPRFAVISVGLTSIFGHPHREVVERWTASEAKVLTTGKSGTITLSTDGNDLRLETFVKE